MRLYEQALFYYQRVIGIDPRHEVALARQRSCTGRAFGLMRVFRREKLHQRWKDEFDKLFEPQEPIIDDF